VQRVLPRPHQRQLGLGARHLGHALLPHHVHLWPCVQQVQTLYIDMKKNMYKYSI
jgi:hypothetical protein